MERDSEEKSFPPPPRLSFGFLFLIPIIKLHPCESHSGPFFDLFPSLDFFPERRLLAVSELIKMRKSAIRRYEILCQRTTELGTNLQIVAQ